MSYIAGANFPNMIIKEYIFNERLEFNNEWKENFLFLRYDSTFVNKDFK